MKKKVLVLFAAVMAVFNAGAYEYENPGFEWSAGAEVTTSYLWRGLKLGGLAFQPDAMVGYGGLHFEAWANLSPTDWSFKEFAPELDLTLSYSIAGFTIGATHYYYFDGTKFFDYSKPTFHYEPSGELIYDTYATNQTELFAKFEFGELIEVFPLSVLWSTYVGGDDWLDLHEDTSNPEKVTGLQRAFSSYFEISYEADLPLGFSLTPTVGFTPWKSMYNFYEGDFSFNNISLKLNWEIGIKDVVVLDVYAIGMLNASGINKHNIFPGIVNSYNNQRLNGCIGLGIWFN